MLDILRETFELHGFAPVETRSVETMETLTRKGEITKEVYVVRRLHAEEGEPGSWTVPGDLHVDEVERLLDRELGDTEAETVGDRRVGRRARVGDRARRGRLGDGEPARHLLGVRQEHPAQHLVAVPGDDGERARELGALPAQTYAFTKRRLRQAIADEVLAGLDGDMAQMVPPTPKG